VNEQPKWLAFDPTIHAGHLVTAVTILCCTLGAWYGMEQRLAILEKQDGQREKDIAAIKADAAQTNAAIQGKIDGLVQVQREEVGKLRDDMNQWFLNLDQKLDRKADKK
jgi:hypothetical protein